MTASPIASPPFQPSEEQKAILNHRGGHLQVVACAGSGKTETISRLIAALVNEGVAPEGIVAFTFTEKAAASLKARITARVADVKGHAFLDRLSPMYIGTIHAYCLRLLQDHTPTLGNHDILDEHRLAGLLSREHKRLGLDKLGPKHWAPIQEFKRNVDVLENELIPLAKLQGTPFGQVCETFYDALNRYHFLTYGQLISAAIRALEDPATFQRIHGKLRYLFVDEYQDVNPAQERLIELLGKPPVNVAVIGDDDQAIYQWRGSNVENILHFTKRYQGVNSKPLSENRRSRPKIIDTANAFANSITPRLPKSMNPVRSAAHPGVFCWSAETQDDEAKVIADTIKSLHARGYRYKDIAVLYRSVRTSSTSVVEEFRKQGIPFSCSGRTGLFQQPEVNVVAQIYAWMVGNQWKDDPYGKPYDIHIEPLSKAISNIFNGHQTADDIASYLDDWQAMAKNKTYPSNLVRDFYKLLFFLGVRNWDLDDPAQAARMGSLARFSQILADFENVTRRGRYVEENGEKIYRGGQDRDIYFYQRLFNYIQHYALDAYEDFEGEETFDLDAVTISTVHQAKGLEWSVVFSPCLVEGRFPSKYAGAPQSWLLPESVFPQAKRQRYQGSEAEERRLFYVAMTRARDTLYLSCFNRKKNRFKPSRFLLEIAGKTPDLQTSLPLPDPYTPPSDSADDIPTLSFSELAVYEGCPLRYRLNNQIGFQAQLVPELGYGKSIHHVLRRLADETKRLQRPLTKTEVNALFEGEFYLPFANRPAFEQLREKATKLIAQYMGNWADDLTRTWETERPFELHLDEGIVSGRADVILDKEDGIIGKLALVDYKTATDPKTDDVFAFQLAIYAAAGRGEGINVEAAYLHDLAHNKRNGMTIDDAATKIARTRASKLFQSIALAQFPPNPDKKKCKQCDQRAICNHAACDEFDL